MSEGLSASEVGKEIGQHASHHGSRAHPHDRLISIAEAILLSVVALTAAWAGYSAAKWSTESRLSLAKASTVRAKANRSYEQAFTTRAQDASNFNAWYSAYLAHDRNAQRVAEKRFRPNYGVAFRAWLAAEPFTNLNAPKGPQYMPQYRPLGEAKAEQLDEQSDALYEHGQHEASTGDKYIRVTVILATVLFLVGISSHFPTRGIRIALVALGAALLAFGAVEILQLPGPPS